jgi:hypothetical protein
MIQMFLKELQDEAKTTRKMLAWCQTTNSSGSRTKKV